MHRLKRWLRRIGIALAAVVVALTIASVIFNLATNGRDAAASTLYPGPYARVDGTELAYRAWGSHGTPVILLGGFIEPSWVWHEVGPRLGRSHRVYALDLPPFGYSQRRGPFTLARWAGLVRGFGRQLGLRRPLLVGHSLGAAVAVTVATDAPRGVAGVVLLDGDARPGGGGARLALAPAAAALVHEPLPDRHRLGVALPSRARDRLGAGQAAVHPGVRRAMGAAVPRHRHRLGIRIDARARNPGRLGSDARPPPPARARRLGEPRRRRLGRLPAVRRPSSFTRPSSRSPGRGTSRCWPSPHLWPRRSSGGLSRSR